VSSLFAGFVCLLLPFSVMAQTVSLSADTVDFGITVPEMSTIKSVVVTNGGGASLQIDSLRILRNFPNIQATPTGTVAAGATQDIYIIFVPPATGVYNDTLEIFSNAPSSPDTVVILAEARTPILNIVYEPFLQLPPTGMGEFNFVSTLVDSTSRFPLTFYNSGTDTLHISSITVTPSVFSMTVGIVNIAPDDSVTVFANFTPAAPISYTGTLRVVSDDPNSSPVDVTLRGSGVNVEPGPLTLDFGQVVVGSPDSVDFPVSNSNATYSMQLDSIVSVAVMDTSYFFVDTTTESIAASADAALQLKFQPDTPDSVYRDTLEFWTSDPTIPQTLIVQGTAVKPQLAFTWSESDSLSFGNVFMNDSVTRTLTLYNNGTGDLILNQFTPSQNFVTFSPTPTLGSPLVSQTITATFSLSVMGTGSGTLLIGSNDPDQASVFIPFSGTSVAPISALAVDTIRVDTVASSDASADTTLNIQNSGTTNLVINALTTPSTGFSTTMSVGDTVAAGGNRTFQVTFAPPNGGTFIDSLIIETNDPNNPSMIQYLVGVKEAPEIDVSPMTLTFADTTVGATHVLSLTVHNTGADTLTLDSVFVVNSLNVTDSVFYSNWGGPDTLAADSSMTVQVTFKPNENHGEEDTLRVLSNALGNPTLSLPLLGNPSSNLYPVIVSQPDTAATQGMLWSYAANATDTDGDSLRYTLISAPSTMTVDSTSGLLQWTPNQAQADVGIYNVHFRVTDGVAGIDSQLFVVTVVDVNEAPVVTSVPDTVAFVDSLYQYQVTANDPDSDPIQFYLVARPQSPSPMNISAGGLITWTPDIIQLGANVVSVQIRDSLDLRTAQTFTIHVSRINRPPVITSTPDTVALDEMPYQYQLTAADPDSDAVSWRLVEGPPSMTVDSLAGLISWTPDDADVGLVTVRVEVRDTLAATATQQFIVAVSDSMEAPILTAVPDTTIYEDISFIYTISAVDEDSNAVLRFTDNATLWTVDSTTGLINFTPVAADTGNFNIAVEVSDGMFTVADTMSLTILPNNDAPVLTAVPDTFMNQGDTLTIAMSATDEETPDDLRFFDFSPFIDIDSLSGVWTLVAGNDVIGEQDILIGVTDGEAADTLAVRLTVVDINEPPVLALPADTTLFEDAAVIYTVPAVDPDPGEALQFTDDTDMFDIDPATGVINFTPTDAHVGSHTVTITVSDNQYTDTAVMTWHILNVNDVPRFPVVADTTLFVGERFTFNAAAVDDDAVAELSYQDNTALFQIDPNTGIIDWTPQPHQAGVHVVTLTVSDGLAVDTVGFQVHVVETNVPPVLAAVADTAVLEGADFLYQVHAVDPDPGTTLRYTDNSPLFTIGELTGLINFSPGSVHIGLHVIDVFVSDGLLADTVRFALTVRNTNDPPVYVGIPAVTFGENSGVVLNLVTYATDPDNPQNSLRWEALVDTGLAVTITDTLAELSSVNEFIGITDLWLIVSDPFGERDTAHVIVEIIGENDAPQLTQNVWYLEGEEDVIRSVSFVDWAQDPDDAALTWSIQDGKHIATQLFPEQSVLALNPAPNWYGIDTLTIMVTDAALAADTGLVIVSVLPVNDAPLLLGSTPAGDSAVVVQGQSIEFSFVVQDVDGDSLLVEWIVDDVLVSREVRMTYQAGAEETGTRHVMLRLKDAKTLVSKSWNLGIDFDTAVILENFSAQSETATGVQVAWTVTDLHNHAHFEVWRADAPDAPGIMIGLPVTQIPQDGRYTILDPAVDAGRQYWYTLVAVDINGTRMIYGPVAVTTTMPEAFQLQQNYPNPFNAGTTIRFALPRAVPVELAIFDLTGRRLRTLVTGRMAAGSHTVQWAGLSDAGRQVGSGVYLCRLRAGDYVSTRRLLLLK
jgi:hypothetical protein